MESSPANLHGLMYNFTLSTNVMHLQMQSFPRTRSKDQVFPSSLDYENIQPHPFTQHPYIKKSASRSTKMSIINACCTRIMQTIIQTPKKLNKIFQGSGIWSHSQQPSTSSWAVHTWIRNRHLRCWNNLIYFPQPVKIYELNLTISKGDIQKC